MMDEGIDLTRCQVYTQPRQWRISIEFSENWRKTDKAKQNTIQVNAVKKSSRITKWERSFDNILSTIESLQGDTKNMNESTDSFLPVNLKLSSETLKDA